MSNQDPDIFNKVDTDEVGDVDDDSCIAPDEPKGSHARGLTADEEREGETFAERDRHTLPEVDEGDRREDPLLVGRLVQNGDEDVDAMDDEAAAIASDEGMDDDMSAEESAMHVTDI